MDGYRHRYGVTRRFLQIIRVIGWIYGPLLWLGLIFRYHLESEYLLLLLLLVSTPLLLVPHILATLGIAALDAADHLQRHPSFRPSIPDPMATPRQLSKTSQTALPDPEPATTSTSNAALERFLGSSVPGHDNTPGSRAVSGATPARDRTWDGGPGL